MFNFFGWLKSKAKEAILQGMCEAAEEVEGVQLPAFDAEEWRRKFTQKALAPAPDAEPGSEPAKAKREKGGRP